MSPFLLILSAALIAGVSGGGSLDWADLRCPPLYSPFVAYPICGLNLPANDGNIGQTKISYFYNEAKCKELSNGRLPNFGGAPRYWSSSEEYSFFSGQITSRPGGNLPGDVWAPLVASGVGNPWIWPDGQVANHYSYSRINIASLASQTNPTKPFVLLIFGSAGNPWQTATFHNGTEEVADNIMCVADADGTNDCNSNPCKNGATCDWTYEGFECQCKDGWTGPTCETDEDGCVGSPCMNGGTCGDLAPDPTEARVETYICKCPAGYTGANCETDIDDCSPDPCQNNGVCTDLVNDFSCSCPPQSGMSGKTCTIDIDECAPSPCKNGATCNNRMGQYTCSCAAGWSGWDCEINEDDCNPNPCEANGVCTDLVNDFVCDCPKGFNGKNCSENLNECTSWHFNVNPCFNGATCVDRDNDYQCVCPPGYDGKDCDNDIDECASSPCNNGGSCSDRVNGYVCFCAPGYTGITCDTDIDECAAAPCKNGATCNDLLARYACTCAAGWTGNDCDINIDDCAPAPCKNGATCTDLVNDFSCACVPGYTDSTCNTDIDECQPMPCENGATCVDLVNAYRCDCTEGYSGVNCSDPDIPRLAIEQGLNTLVSLVMSTNLTSTLASEGPFTVLAPLDSEFADFNVSRLSPEEMTSLLTYHVLPGRVGTQNLTNELILTTVEGSPLRINAYPSPFIENSTMYTAQCAYRADDPKIFDLEATNGLIHVLYGVMTPPKGHIADKVASEPQFATLLSKLRIAGLVDTLSGPGPFTLLAPTNEAWATLRSAQLNLLLSHPESLAAVLTHHVVPGTYCEAALIGIGNLTSVHGGDIAVSEWGDTLDNATVLDVDLSVTNGVIHVIDKVLLPPEFTFPESFVGDFELTIADIDLPDWVFVEGSAERRELVEELQLQILLQMQEENPDVVDVEVKDIRPGSLVADVTVTIASRLNPNPAGTFLKAASQVKIETLQVRSVAGAVFSGNGSVVKIFKSANGTEDTELRESLTPCEVRNKTFPCEPEEKCVDNEGIAECKLNLLDSVAYMYGCLHNTLGSLPRSDGLNVLLEDECVVQQWVSVCGMSLYDVSDRSTRDMFMNVLSRMNRENNCRFDINLLAISIQEMHSSIVDMIPKETTFEGDMGRDTQECISKAWQRDVFRDPLDWRCSYVEDLTDCFITPFIINTPDRQGDAQMMGYEGQGKPGGPGGLMGQVLGNMMSQNANKGALMAMIRQMGLVCTWNEQQEMDTDSAPASLNVYTVLIVGFASVLTSIWMRC